MLITGVWIYGIMGELDLKISRTQESVKPALCFPREYTLKYVFTIYLYVHLPSGLFVGG